MNATYLKLLLAFFFFVSVVSFIANLLIKKSFQKRSKLSVTLYFLLLISTGGLLYFIMMPSDGTISMSATYLIYYLMSIPIWLINIETSFACRRSFKNIFLIFGAILFLIIQCCYLTTKDSGIWMITVIALSYILGLAVFSYYSIVIIGRWLKTKRSAFENEEFLFVLISIAIFYSGYIYSFSIKDAGASVIFLSAMYLAFLWITFIKISFKRIPFVNRGEYDLNVFMPVNVFSAGDSDKDDPFEQLKDQLLDYFAKSKPYLKDSLKIDEVALALMTNKTYLSRTLNMKMNVNFNQFVNYFRVKESMRMYLDNRNMNVKEMCHKSGFTNIASFTQAFKINTGRTPAEWCREVRSNAMTA